MRCRPLDTELARFPSAVAFDLIMLENAFDWLCVFASARCLTNAVTSALVFVQFIHHAHTNIHNCILTCLCARYTYDSNFIDPSTQITGFTSFYPYQVLEKFYKLPELSNSSGGSGLTLQLMTDSSNLNRRNVTRE